MCTVEDIDILFCSTSCKDLSKNNSNKAAASTILDGGDTPGGSVQTFKGLCDLLASKRPDILVFENVVDMEEERDGGNSDLNIVIEKWKALGYESQVVCCNSRLYGIPQNRLRLYIVAVNTHDPKTLDFSERSIDDVFETFQALLKVCERKAACASTFLLPNTDAHVLADLQRLQDEREPDKGYSLEKPMQIAQQHSIAWGSFPPTALLKESRWFNTFSKLAQDSLCFSMAVQPGPIFFRDMRPSFGRTRVSSRGENNEVVASTCMPSQQLMVFDDTTEREPRIVLGRESLFLHGFPMDIIDEFEGTFKENLMMDIAGNMVSPPVMLAITLAIMASVSWTCVADDQGTVAEDAEDVLEENVDVPVPTESEHRQAATIGGAPSTEADDDGLMRGPRGLAVAEENAKEKENNASTCKRRGGLLNHVFAKVLKTDMAPGLAETTAAPGLA